MAHNLEINGDGTARFAYSNHQRPWHLLGTPMLGLQTVDTMLAAADADFAVRIVKIAAVDENGQLLTNPDGTPVLIEDSRATIRDNGNGLPGATNNHTPAVSKLQDRAHTLHGLLRIASNHNDGTRIQLFVKHSHLTTQPAI